jgi:hypothetical protein
MIGWAAACCLLAVAFGIVLFRDPLGRASSPRKE